MYFQFVFSSSHHYFEVSMRVEGGGWRVDLRSTPGSRGSATCREANRLIQADGSEFIGWSSNNFSNLHSNISLETNK